ncbi:DUF6325 family protein [Salsipaludibacter albus]|uniref:DUF6325 family protein n=1 Tax=Salsipaludibacter albus TaxID=2849650 RepID=UPI001EE4644F|nr:DUF6325 family protein [Salsipaludibacter albus]MBY5161320.1 DUF1269 domain-containing protein [Salsipaludibacter albus]
MSAPTPHGPVDFLLVEFPTDQPIPAVADELLALVEQGTIRLWDLLVARKDADGLVTVIDLQDVTADGPASLAVFAGARSGLIGDDDLDDAGAIMEPGTTAALLVYENAWAVPFVTAAMAAGGQAVASMRIPATDITEALDELEATQPVA